ncbi:MAG: sporulation protein YabP [Halanaerobiales bacterium]|nr:sporulation protein YabP [Halanaerobiales bacterium]
MDNNRNEKNTNKTHSFSLKDRKSLEMKGVLEVVSFNENKVILQTTQGNLFVKGSELNIINLNLDDGSIKVEGYVTSLEYSEKTQKTGIFNRLFK